MRKIQHKVIEIQKDGPLIFTQLKVKMNSASAGLTLQLVKLLLTQCSLPNAFNSASLTTSPQKLPRLLYLSQMLLKALQVFTKSPEHLLLSKLTLLRRRQYRRSMVLPFPPSTPSTQSMALWQQPKAGIWSMPMKCSSMIPKTLIWS